MDTFDVSGEFGRDNQSRNTNKRVVFICLLSAFLIMLGSIPLSNLSSLKNHVSQQSASLAVSHHTRTTHTSIPSPASTSIPKKVHAPVLNYPLFNGSTHIPEIALTFDDGPNPFYTPQILDILQRYGIEATFFDVGYLVADYPNIVRQEYHQGNIVANHSWSHPVLTNFSAQGIQS